jgi:hypothetical protein
LFVACSLRLQHLVTTDGWIGPHLILLISTSEPPPLPGRALCDASTTGESLDAILDLIRAHLLALPSLAKFALILGIIAGVPALSRRLRLPAAVGLLFSGLVIGPHGGWIWRGAAADRDFFAELGKVLLMFMAGSR